MLKRLLWTGLVSFLVPAIGWSQDCDPEQDELIECIRKIEAGMVSEEERRLADYRAVSAAEIADARRDIRVTTTGDVPLSIGGSSVSLNDLLPVLNIAAEPSPDSDDADSGGIVIEGVEKDVHIKNSGSGGLTINGVKGKLTK